MKPIAYEHFHAEEKSFIDKAAGWIADAAERKKTKRTDFLDPRQSFILLTLANREDGAVVRTDGGYDGAERRRALVVPDFLDPESEPSGVALLAVTSEDERAGRLDHGDYLGAMVHLGVKREKIGDIHVHAWGAHMLVAEEMLHFFTQQLSRVGRTEVRTESLPLSELVKSAERVDETVVTVASMRLDGVAGEAFRLSRAKVAPLIAGGRCKVNWKVEDRPSCQVKEGDIISLQGFGRCRLTAVDGLSKKGRIRIRLGKYV